MLILDTANTEFELNGRPNFHALYDLVATSSYLTLEAVALGLVTHQMASFDHEAMRQHFEIPEEYALGCVIALGHQGEPAALVNEGLRTREYAPRERKPLNELVFSA